VAVVLASASTVPAEVTATGLPVVRWADIRPRTPSPAEGREAGRGCPKPSRGWVFVTSAGSRREIGVWAPELAGMYEGGWCRGWYPPGFRSCRKYAPGKVLLARNVDEERAAIRRLLRRDGWRGAEIGAWPLPLTADAAWVLEYRLWRECDAIFKKALRIPDPTAAAKYTAHALTAILGEAGAYAASGGKGGGNES